MAEKFESSISAPLVIGATGGSGTRVVARIAKHAGYCFGTNLNGAEDALDFLPFHDRWVNVLLGARRRHRTLSREDAHRMTREFQEVLTRYRSTITGSNAPLQFWGWKAPRSIYLMAFLHEQFPALKYIHVLRDGRDMAFSRNQNQLRKHGHQLLSWRERWFEGAPVRSLLLWDRVNRHAADYGETRLRQGYLAVRFEDLCRAPGETTRRILRFLESSLDAEAIARQEIAPPNSLGRWREAPPEVRARFERVAGATLRRFGYEEPVA